LLTLPKQANFLALCPDSVNHNRRICRT